jgi:glycosyltransferase involved in cell wall biosynthesis
MAIAYLSNQFPAPTESYVWDEIKELRRNGREVLCCSFRRTAWTSPDLRPLESETLYVFPVTLLEAARAVLALAADFRQIADLLLRCIRGPEPFKKRLRTMGHTWLGACLAGRLRSKQITHIHVHHGYFSAWTGMIAARLLDASFSMTLHGSDLLVRADYIESKLNECLFCVTVSDFNRKHILQHYPQAAPGRILVHRIGVDLEFWRPAPRERTEDEFSIVSAGRLHRVKNQAFLMLACRQLKNRGVRFSCQIAGEGEEREALEGLIEALGLSHEVQLLGTVSARQLRDLYSEADVVALTSHSEGIPVTLMEAMAMGRIVLAPAITGIPELVEHGRTGFLYEPESINDFISKLDTIRIARSSLAQMRYLAARQVERKFNRRSNLEALARDFLRRTSDPQDQNFRAPAYENPLLQQIQLPIQRDRNVSAPNHEADAFSRT